MKNWLMRIPLLVLLVCFGNAKAQNFDTRLLQSIKQLRDFGLGQFVLEQVVQRSFQGFLRPWFCGFLFDQVVDRQPDPIGCRHGLHVLSKHNGTMYTITEK